MPSPTATPRRACVPRSPAVLPLGDAGRAVDRDDVAQRRLDVEHAVDGDRACSGCCRLVMPPSMWLTQAPPSCLMLPVLIGVERRVVLVAEVAADLRKVGVAGGAAVVERGGTALLRERERGRADGAAEHEGRGQSIELHVVSFAFDRGGICGRQEAIETVLCHRTSF